MLLHLLYFRRIQSIFSTSLLSMPTLPFRFLISNQASSAFYEISYFHVILVKPAKLTLLRRRIRCREAVACDFPLAVSLSEDKQFLIRLISFATTLNNSGTGRVGTCILSAGMFQCKGPTRYLRAKAYSGLTEAFVCLAHIGDTDE